MAASCDAARTVSNSAQQALRFGHLNSLIQVRVRLRARNRMVPRGGGTRQREVSREASLLLVSYTRTNWKHFDAPAIKLT